MISKLNLLNFIIFLMSCTIISASEDYKDKLQIDSDLLLFDKSKDTAEFQGKIIIRFEDLILISSKLKIFYKKNTSNKKEIDQIIIPNSLKAIKIKSNEVLIAASGIYFNNNSKLILQEAEVMKDGNILKTKELIYHGALKKISSTNNLE